MIAEEQNERVDKIKLRKVKHTDLSFKAEVRKFGALLQAKAKAWLVSVLSVSPAGCKSFSSKVFESGADFKP